MLSFDYLQYLLNNIIAKIRSFQTIALFSETGLVLDY